MSSRKLLAAILLGLSLSVNADFRTIAEAYEVNFSDLRLPGNAYGTLTFRKCSDCDLQTTRVNGDTRYLINNRNLALKEFKEQLKRIGIREDRSITVLHHLESDTITEIKVRL